jgi:hypothetical protein
MGLPQGRTIGFIAHKAERRWARGVGQQASTSQSARDCLGGRGIAPAKGQAGAGRFVAGQICQELQCSEEECSAMRHFVSVNGREAVPALSVGSNATHLSVVGVAPVRFLRHALERALRRLALHELAGSLITLLPVSIVMLELGTPSHCTTPEVISSILGHHGLLLFTGCHRFLWANPVSFEHAIDH